MRVRDLMTRDVATCGPNTDLATAAMMMWEADCGSIPVVDDLGRAVGMVTDRDICMAVATRRCKPDALRAGDMISPELFQVSPDDEIDRALHVMREGRVRRLPVVEADRKLLGILSVNDLILHAGPGRAGRKAPLSRDALLETMKAVCEHRVGAGRKDSPAGA